VLLAVVALFVGGCAAPKVDFSTIQRPARAAELDAYDVFVGSWNWTAEIVNCDTADRKWSGTAEWHWTLDKRCLHGQISSKSGGGREFNAAGIWSWHPKARHYMWWMFNDWGFPQQGVAHYDAAARKWTMKYTGVGLDGTSSHGQYEMTVQDNNTLTWSMIEWADALHLVKKMEMNGTYQRTK